MKISYICLLLFAICLSAACRPAATPVMVSDQPISINDIPNKNLPMPPRKPFGDMTWTTFDGITNLDGADQKLGDLRGKVVVLDFWATYCPPCLEEIPHLNALQQKYGSEGFEIIGLHSGGADDRPKVPEFAQSLKIGYTLATPERDLESFVFYSDSAIPQTLVIGRDGTLIEKFVGFDSQVKDALDNAVLKALSK